MQDNNISSTNCLKVNFMSIDRLFMCELERTNGTKNTQVVQKKRLKKIRRCILTYLIALLKLCEKILQTSNCMINYHLRFLIPIKRGLTL